MEPALSRPRSSWEIGSIGLLQGGKLVLLEPRGLEPGARIARAVAVQADGRTLRLKATTGSLVIDCRFRPS